MVEVVGLSLARKERNVLHIKVSINARNTIIILDRHYGWQVTVQHTGNSICDRISPGLPNIPNKLLVISLWLVQCHLNP